MTMFAVALVLVIMVILGYLRWRKSTDYLLKKLGYVKSVYHADVDMTFDAYDQDYADALRELNCLFGKEAGK